MKKILLATMLVLVFVLSLSLAACDNPVAKIEVKNGTINNTYKVGEEIDYSKGILSVTYEDGGKGEVKFTDKGVEYTPVDTSKEGSVTLIVKYGGKTAEFAIEITSSGEIITATVDSFEMPQNYQNYLDRSSENDNGENAFTKKSGVYKVGSVNKFQFYPICSGFDDNDQMLDFGADVVTTMKLYQKSDVNADYTELTADQAATYVTKDGNYYKFNEVANNEYFKMEVSLDTTKYDVAPTLDPTTLTLTIEFQVVDAYNAYDMFGLSVYDNLNVNRWAAQKNRTLRWDDKKLSEYTDVTLVVLHNDIDINPDNLPQDYFWTENTVIELLNDEDGTKRSYSEAKSFFDSCNFPAGSKLEGSLIDGVGNGGVFRLNLEKDSYSLNSIQKALYMTNQCSLSGNYMAVKPVAAQTSGRQLVTYVTNEKGAGNNPKSHWAFFGAFKTDDQSTLNLSLEDVDITGNMQRVNVSDGIAAGLLGISTGTDCLDITNVNMRKCFTHIIVVSNSDNVTTGSEYGSSAINLTDSKLTDAYSNMVYLWRTVVNVENSVMDGAGGPLFIAVDGERTKNDYEGTDYRTRKCNIIVDDKSVLKADAAGTESWYKIYHADTLFAQIKSMDALLQGYCNVTIQHKNEQDENITMLNLIAVLCPDPSDIMKSANNADERIWIKGDFTRNNKDGAEKYSMEDSVYWGSTAGVGGIDLPLPAGGIKATNLVLFKSGNAYAFMNSTTSLAHPAGANLQETWANHSDLMCIYMTAGSLCPYFGVIVGNVENVG